MYLSCIDLQLTASGSNEILFVGINPAKMISDNRFICRAKTPNDSENAFPTMHDDIFNCWSRLKLGKVVYGLYPPPQDDSTDTWQLVIIPCVIECITCSWAGPNDAFQRSQRSINFTLNEKWMQYEKYHTVSLQWRRNDRDGVSNHHPHNCLLSRLFRHRSKKTSTLRVTSFCVGNSPVTSEFPAQTASNAENVSIWWRLMCFASIIPYVP